MSLFACSERVGWATKSEWRVQVHWYWENRYDPTVINVPETGSNLLPIGFTRLLGDTVKPLYCAAIDTPLCCSV